jgi:hypothetical protein
MNLSEVEIVLKDLVKEVQETKALVEKTEPSQVQNELSDTLSYSLRILPKKVDHMKALLDLVVKKEIKDNKMLSSESMEKLQRSLDRTIQQLAAPTPQRIRHEHSFKEWKWLLLLLFFIGLSIYLSWRSFTRYNQYHELLIKYDYVQQEAPNFIRAVDSVYNRNPYYFLDHPLRNLEQNKIPEKTSSKKRNAKKKK